MVEVPASRDLALLAPGFRRKAEAIVARMKAAGLDPVIHEGRRTWERQWSLYGKGRTPAQCSARSVPIMYAWPTCPDGIVTKAPGIVQSSHGYGLAVDIISKADAWDFSAAFTAGLRDAAAAEGCQWGGLWADPVDRPHVQVGDWDGRPPELAQRMLLAFQLPALWRLLNLDT